MFLSSYHHEIFRRYYHWQTWYPCKRSRSKVKGQDTEVTTPLSCFWTVTPVWIHIWKWNDAQSLMLLRRGTLLFSRSSVRFQGHAAKKPLILTQNGYVRTVTPVWIHQWLWNDAQSLKQRRRGALLLYKVIRQFSRSHGTKNCRVWHKLSVYGL